MRPHLAATPAQRAAVVHRLARIDQAHRASGFTRAVLRATRGEREVVRRAIKLSGYARRAAKLGARDR